jgi:cation transport ATPase
MRSAVDYAKNTQSQTEEIVNRIAAWYTLIVVAMSISLSFMPWLNAVTLIWL